MKEEIEKQLKMASENVRILASYILEQIHFTEVLRMVSLTSEDKVVEIYFKFANNFFWLTVSYQKNFFVEHSIN